MRSSELVLFVCSGLLLSGGAILGGSTAWSLLRMSYYFWTSDLGVELGSSVLFISGALLCLPACWVATLVPYERRSLPLLTTLMVLVTSGMLVLSVGLSSLAALSRALREPGALNASMARAMALEAYDPAVRSAFASMHMELKCCGVQSPSDWYQYRRTLPPSCCGRAWNGKQGDKCEIPLYSAGCARAARAELRSYANSLSVLACAIIIVKAVALFAAAYSLVTGVAESGSGGNKPQRQLRVACVASPPFTSAPLASPPFISAPLASPPHASAALTPLPPRIGVPAV